MHASVIAHLVTLEASGVGEEHVDIFGHRIGGNVSYARAVKYSELEG